MTPFSKFLAQKGFRIGICVFLVVFVGKSTFNERISQAQEFSQVDVRESIEKIAEAINNNYFDVGLASRIQKDLLLRLENNEYNEIRTPKELANRITVRLTEMTQDKHLVVSPRQLSQTADNLDELPGIDEKQAAAKRAAQRALVGRRSNFGLQKIEILPGNIAYMNFTSFYRVNEIDEILAAAMKMAANADAIILDMRYNMGGSTGAVSLLSSYFFEGPQRKLFDVVDRAGEARTYSTDPTVLNRNGTRPVYVLVHSTTFSAGEGLAFLMQDQTRATVIGETTAGAANPGRPYYANDWFEVNVPNGQIKVAISGGNWEGTGVTPDIDSKGKDALLISQRVALKDMIQKETDEAYLAKLKSWLDELN